MKKLWTKNTRTTLLLLIILFLSAALLIQADGNSSGSNASYSGRTTSWERSASLSLTEDDISETISGYRTPAHVGDATSSVQATPPPPAPEPVEHFQQPKNRDLENANGLVSSLRRIVRAGNSMDALRSTDNSTLRRRCYDGMKRLQAETIDIRKRRRNIALPSSSVSLSKVFNSIMKCVSCDGDAKNYCAMAEQDLAVITRSLSIN